MLCRRGSRPPPAAFPRLWAARGGGGGWSIDCASSLDTGPCRTATTPPPRRPPDDLNQFVTATTSEKSGWFDVIFFILFEIGSLFIIKINQFSLFMVVICFVHTAPVSFIWWQRNNDNSINRQRRCRHYIYIKLLAVINAVTRNMCSVIACNRFPGHFDVSGKMTDKKSWPHKRNFKDRTKTYYIISQSTDINFSPSKK